MIGSWPNLVGINWVWVPYRLTHWCAPESGREKTFVSRQIQRNLFVINETAFDMNEKAFDIKETAFHMNEKAFNINGKASTGFIQ